MNAGGAGSSCFRVALSTLPIASGLPSTIPVSVEQSMAGFTGGSSFALALTDIETAMTVNIEIAAVLPTTSEVFERREFLCISEHQIEFSHNVMSEQNKSRPGIQLYLAGSRNLVKLEPEFCSDLNLTIRVGAGKLSE
jgi:hypothetical protein